MTVAKERELEVLVAMQQALLGEVSNKLRAVYVSWTDSSVHFDCYFDGEIDEIDVESMWIVDTEILAAFPEAHQITHAVHRWDYPKPIPVGRMCVFSRREPKS